MPRIEIRITGFGGQGVVMCGYVVGRAYAIEAGHQATMIQSFGPEARGSSCSATLVLSEDEILYPYARRPHALVAMSAEGYDKFRHELRSDGILIYELLKDVSNIESENIRLLKRIAELVEADFTE